MAHRLIQAAAQTGADAIKFQTFKAERLATKFAPKAKYQEDAISKDENQLDMLKKLELPIDAYISLIKECEHYGIIFMSTPFDEESADLLNSLGILIYKISSGDLTNLPLISHIAKKEKPIILSTGMSYLCDVDIAVRTIYENCNRELALLHCTSNYPANPEDINLRAMNTLAQAFQVPTGLSDHSEGIEIPIAAVAMGASIIEKHFTLDRELPGPDQKASLEPVEMKRMVSAIKKIEAALGHGRKEPVEREAETMAVSRKSLIARINISSGTKLQNSHFAILRPGTGLPPILLPYLVGRVTRIDIPAGTLLSLDMFE
jgi:N-acetylneuraminate synthase